MIVRILGYFPGIDRDKFCKYQLKSPQFTKEIPNWTVLCILVIMGLKREEFEVVYS